MKIEGIVLDVNDGDAIIIKAQKGDESLLVVIDGGDEGFSAKTLRVVQQYCTEMNKEAPDLVVCTHYDSDHIAGIVTLVEHYKEKIGKVWVQQPKGVVKDAMRAAPMVLEHIANKAKQLDFNSFLLYQNYLAAPQYEKYRLVIESIGQLETLIGLIKDYNIPTEEPIVGKCSLPGWDEIKLIGPTQEYFNKVFKQKNLFEIFQEEYEYMILEDVRKKNQLTPDPCSQLKTTSRITATNKASAIIRFDCEDGNYLFAADAGIESLKETVGYPESIRNLKFLKIPHHGSNNNMSSELVSIMNPEIAYNSGKIHEDAEVIACLRSKTGRIVKTTNESGDLSF